MNFAIAGSRPVMCRAAPRMMKMGAIAPAPIAKPSLVAPLRRIAVSAPRLPQRIVQTPAASASTPAAPAPQGKNSMAMRTRPIHRIIYHLGSIFLLYPTIRSSKTATTRIGDIFSTI